MIYEYRCKKCEHTFEISCKLADIDVIRPCPECQSEETERYFSSMPSMAPCERLMGRTNIGEFRDVLKSIADRTPGGHVMKDKIR